MAQFEGNDPDVMMQFRERVRQEVTPEVFDLATGQFEFLGEVGQQVVAAAYSALNHRRERLSPIIPAVTGHPDTKTMLREDMVNRLPRVMEMEEVPEGAYQVEVRMRGVRAWSTAEVVLRRGEEGDDIHSLDDPVEVARFKGKRVLGEISLTDVELTEEASRLPVAKVIGGLLAERATHFGDMVSLVEAEEYTDRLARGLHEETVWRDQDGNIVE